MSDALEIWKYHPATGLWASNFGRVKRVYKNGNEHFLGFWDRCPRHNKQIIIHWKRNKQIFAKTVIWEAFYGKKPENMCVYHLNGIRGDNSIYNLALKTHEEVGKSTGHKSRSCKVYDKKLDKIYRSGRQALKDHYCSYQMIYDICNGKVKKPQYDLWWWDEDNEIAYRGKRREKEDE